MKALYLDPQIPRRESTDAMLRRFSSNIGTLTELINEAERTGHLYLAGMFSRSRAAKVVEAQAAIALVNEGDANGIKEIVSPSLPAEGRLRHAADSKGRTYDERPEVGSEFMPANALLLMDTAAVGPERRFLLVGISATGIGTAPIISRRPRRNETRFALADGGSSVLPGQSSFA